MYTMTIKYIHQLLDGLHLVLVVEVLKGVQHVSGVLKIILNQNHFKSISRQKLGRNGLIDSTWQKKYFHQLLDGLHIVLVVDDREGVLHVSEVLEIILNRFSFKN